MATRVGSRWACGMSPEEPLIMVVGRGKVNLGDFDLKPFRVTTTPANDWRGARGGFRTRPLCGRAVECGNSGRLVLPLDTTDRMHRSTSFR